MIYWRQSLAVDEQLFVFKLKVAFEFWNQCYLIKNQDRFRELVLKRNGNFTAGKLFLFSK